MTEWAEEALDNPALVTRGLREMAWDPASINTFLEQYLAVRASSSLPRGSRITRIRELLGLRRRETEEVTTDWIRVPLYRFGAPPVDGAKVEYSEGESIVDGSGWSLKVFGIGAGDTTSLQVSKSRTFTATAGTCKMVFVPVMLRVSRVAVYEGKRLVGRGYEAQVASLKDSGDPHLQRRGCISLGAQNCGSGPDEHYDVVDVSLAGDRSGAIHHDRRSWETDVAREVSVGLAKFVDVSALVRVKRTRRLELAFELPSGHDYRAYLCDGLTWWDRPLAVVSKTTRKRQR